VQDTPVAAYYALGEGLHGLDELHDGLHGSHGAFNGHDADHGHAHAHGGWFDLSRYWGDAQGDEDSKRDFIVLV